MASITNSSLSFSGGVDNELMCRACGKTNMKGRRFKCLRCPNYDLCSDCYDNGRTSTDHLADHPVQVILDRAARELFFAGEEMNPNIPDNYTCPYCSQMGLTKRNLVKHVKEEHTAASDHVICPICVVIPYSVAVPIQNLRKHFEQKHENHFQLQARRWYNRLTDRESFSLHSNPESIDDNQNGISTLYHLNNQPMPPSILRRRTIPPPSTPFTINDNNHNHLQRSRRDLFKSSYHSEFDTSPTTTSATSTDTDETNTESEDYELISNTTFMPISDTESD